ncbi:hypothetical protein GLOTRDRAFT_96225 [Gloeophyllum trabeum ATCC 11539]|uniref:C2H2-type domain-containing protein n=1 Tax=Gloeophyllum trabeum (strain ATCC 11539 / FP-39264 / Madison 617) TaxID=670483 RepID=S7PVA7_GLOTA|nr:uncharacterized protein GLOTRDRAFT_96225 [Gloeophyllum trabeum ATCC 11539]EPQ51463.1 hypothetical protein GLOTRDRAFT_96225 [Gloeophyllum trabeum ATCC 11539]
MNSHLFFEQGASSDNANFQYPRTAAQYYIPDDTKAFGVSETSFTCNELTGSISGLGALVRDDNYLLGLPSSVNYQSAMLGTGSGDTSDEALMNISSIQEALADFWTEFGAPQSTPDDALGISRPYEGTSGLMGTPAVPSPGQLILSALPLPEGAERAPNAGAQIYQSPPTRFDFAAVSRTQQRRIRRGDLRSAPYPSTQSLDFHSLGDTSSSTGSFPLDGSAIVMPPPPPIAQPSHRQSAGPLARTPSLTNSVSTHSSPESFYDDLMSSSPIFLSRPPSVATGHGGFPPLPEGTTQQSYRDHVQDFAGPSSLPVAQDFMHPTKVPVVLGWNPEEEYVGPSSSTFSVSAHPTPFSGDMAHSSRSTPVDGQGRANTYYPSPAVGRTPLTSPVDPSPDCYAIAATLLTTPAPRCQWYGCGEMLPDDIDGAIAHIMDCHVEGKDHVRCQYGKCRKLLKRSGVRRHLASKGHLDKKLACPRCGLVLCGRLDALRRHLGTACLKCSRCSQTFPSKQDFDGHVCSRHSKTGGGLSRH